MANQILLTRERSVLPSSSPVGPSTTTTIRSHAPTTGIIRDEVRQHGQQDYQHSNQIIEKQKRITHSVDSLQTTKRAKIELDNGMCTINFKKLI
jgi:hypothetical protein